MNYGEKEIKGVKCRMSCSRDRSIGLYLPKEQSDYLHFNY